MKKIDLCGICSRRLDTVDDPFSVDCGGDCIACMAEFGDPGCIAYVEKIKSELKSGLASENPTS